MRILVTGGAGFIGSHISDLLVTSDELIIIDNLSSGKKAHVHIKAKFYETDLKDHRKIDSIFAKEAPEAIIHLAAQKSVTKSVADPIYDAQENIIASLTLFEAAKRHGVKKIVFSSTGGGLYGEANVIPTPEEHPTLAQAPYGIAKRTIEDYLRFYALTHQFQPVILRFANVYGPRQDPQGEAGVVSIFCHKLLQGEPLIVYGDGEQTRDYVYVKDAARAFAKALQATEPMTVNIGTAEETSVNKLIKYLASFADQNAPITNLPAREGEVRRSLLDSTKAKTLLGWEPMTKLNIGLRETFQWMKAERH